MRYVYSVLRFVPDSVRGESINIGAIVGSEETDEWSLDLISNTRRARAIDNKGVLPEIWSYVDSIGRQLDYFTEGADDDPSWISADESWLEDLYQRSNNLIQLSRPAPIVAGSLRSATRMVFEQFVVDLAPRKFDFVKKNVAMAAVRKSYREHGMKRGEQFIEAPEVHGRAHSATFDFTVANGHAVQLAQTYSLQVPNKKDLFENIKSWAFTVEDIRAHGGTAVKGGREIEVSGDVPIVVVYVPPKDDEDGSVLEEAMSAFNRVEAHAYRLDDADRAGIEAQTALAKQG